MTENHSQVHNKGLGVVWAGFAGFFFRQNPQVLVFIDIIAPVLD